MVRTQILLDRETYDLLRRAATARGSSVSAFVRETLRDVVGGPRPRAGRRRYGFTFVGCVRGGRRDVAEHHDAVLARGGRW
jgi:hypothetical protein